MTRFEPNQPQTDPQDPLSPAEAAALLGVNVKTIHALLAQGLPHQRIGRRIIRIRRDELLAWGRTKNTA